MTTIEPTADATPQKKPISSQNSRTPAEAKKRRRGVPWWLTLLALPYVAVLLVISVFNIIGPERWWLTGILQYMPHWLLPIPAIPLIVLALLFARRALWFPLLLTLWAAGPLMGFRFNPMRAVVTPAPAAGATTLRVMTWNAKWGRVNAGLLSAEVKRVNPDILMTQDSHGIQTEVLRDALIGYNIKNSGQYMIASRLPISEPESVDISFPGSNHHAMRCVVNVGDREIALYNVHLLSPRHGLAGLKNLWKNVVKDNLDARLYEAKMLAERIRSEQIPVVLGGDLNAPNPTQVCRRLFQVGLHDAFAESGTGYGYTYGGYTAVRYGRYQIDRLWPYVRIDHILLSRGLTSRSCYAGTADASEHNPVIAEIVVPTK